MTHESTRSADTAPATPTDGRSDDDGRDGGCGPVNAECVESFHGKRQRRADGPDSVPGLVLEASERRAGSSPERVATGSTGPFRRASAAVIGR